MNRRSLLSLLLGVVAAEAIADLPAPAPIKAERTPLPDLKGLFYTPEEARAIEALPMPPPLPIRRRPREDGPQLVEPA